MNKHKSLNEMMAEKNIKMVVNNFMVGDLSVRVVANNMGHDFERMANNQCNMAIYIIRERDWDEEQIIMLGGESLVMDIEDHDQVLVHAKLLLSRLMLSLLDAIQ